MTYKDSISGFRTQLEDIAFSRGVPTKKYSNLEIIYKLSLVQSEISNQYRLYEVKTTITTTGIQEYTLDSALADCLNVIKLSIDTESNLDKISIDEMNLITAESGDPTRYAIYGTGSARKIKFDTLYTGTITAFYYKRLDPYDSTDTSFDETKTGYGLTSWLIPEEYHWLLIDGALAKIFPDMMSSHYKRLHDILSRKMVMGIRTKGFLGI